MARARVERVQARRKPCHDSRSVARLAPNPFAVRVLFVALLSSCLFAPRADAAETPRSGVDAANEKLASRARSAGRDPRGIVPLLMLWENWDRSTPSRLVAQLETLAKDARLPPDRRVLIESMLAEGRMRLGDTSLAQRRYEELGYVTQFRVVGPFDNEGKAGFDVETPPEQKRMQAPDLLEQYPGRERSVAWRELPDALRAGFVSFGAMLRPNENACALAETFVKSDRARPLSLWVGAGGAVKVYWNGDEVLRDASYRKPHPDRSVALVGAHAGWNRVLVKVCTTNTAWGFQLRIGDERGGVAKGLGYATNTISALDIPKGQPKLRLPKPPLGSLAWFEAEALRKPDSAPLLADFARFLDLTGSDDPAERRAKQLAERAAELDPSVANLRLAAQLAEQRAEVLRFVDRAVALHPDDAETRFMHASTVASGPGADAALPLLSKIAPDSDDGTAAVLIRAGLLRDLELPRTALALLRAEHARVGDTVELLRALADAESDAAHPDQALALRARVLQLRADDADARRALIDDALARGEMQRVIEHLETLRAMSPGSIRTLLYVASLYDALGKDDMVLATYRLAMAIAPEAEGVYVLQARALLRADDSEGAAEALRSALALKPQNTEARELLENIEPEPRRDEAYAVSTEELLSRRNGGSGYPYTVLQDLNVRTVFESGLGSSFRQLAVQVHDSQGARRFRVHSFPYDPDTQNVDLRLSRVYRKDGRVLESVRTYEEQLGEPWYRVYYDTRAMVVVFPDLEPGDVVELRYRIDDVAHRNLFADYFGELHSFRDFVPVRRTDYVLITPVSREIYGNAPRVPGLTRTQSVAGKQRIDHYRAENLPALVAEDSMPGITEASPVLHVSTYRSWQDVGRWYWGLIKDQLYADAALQRTVAELVKDAKSTREKVERIHAWAVGHTRYVALEFGIHGFLPYRVPLVVQRGFGDCKDKASLMYTMLREAGIDARIVLVRTRRNGAVEELPASLAVFDHAITYVPELDLYLDGTAEHSGITELPTGDQGVMVLLVGPNGSELRRTPRLSAEQNLRTRTLTVQLEADGSARIDGTEEVTGDEAAGYRDYYQAEGTRAERLERSLGALYPGVELVSQRFESLSDLSRPVRYSYRIRVPELAHRSGDGLEAPPSVLSDLVRSMARTPTRVHALDLQTARSYVEERNLELPSGMRVSSLPSGGEASSPWGRLSLQYSAQKGSVKVRTELTIAKDRIEPADYPAFRRWVEAADQLSRQRILVRRGEP